MFRGEGEMDSHIWKYLWVILLNSSFGLFLLRIMGTSSFFLSLSFFKEDNPRSFLNLVFLEGAFEEFWAELWWNYLVKVDDNTRSR